MRLFEQALLNMVLAGASWEPDDAAAAAAIATASTPPPTAEALGLRARAQLKAAYDAQGDYTAVELLEAAEGEARALACGQAELAHALLGRLLEALEHFEKLPKKGASNEQTMLLRKN